MFASAGDLEKYAYCPLSWWLSKKHKVVYKEGVKKHKEIQRELKEIQKKESRIKFYEKHILFFATASTILAIAGLALLGSVENVLKYFFVTVALFWLLNSAFFLYRGSKAPPILKIRYEKLLLVSSMGALIVAFFVILFSIAPNKEISKFVEILSLLWVIIASLIFYRSLYLAEKIVEKKIKYAPLESEIEYVGTDAAEEIISEKYELRGKPDYIIRVGDDYIPVEEKTTERNAPHLPHVIQLTAYCMLIEDKYGKSPPYGIIRYKNVQFKVPYELRWKEMVLELKKKMEDDLKRGEAHRNHYNIKKCKNCVRKEFCPERLA